MRISGFASGFDIDAMVKQLMTAHRAPLEKLQQKTTRIEWQQEAYRSISTTFVDFRNNKLSTFGQSSSIDAKKADITGNASAVSATVTGASTNSSLSVEVTKLAKAASVQFNTGIAGDNASKTLGELDGWSTSSGTVTVNGVPIQFNKSTDTIQSLVKKINDNKEAKVTALYDSTSGKVSITANATGEGDVVLGGDFSAAANLITGVDPKAGENATAIVNGLQMSSQTNQITVNGTTIQLKQLSGTGGASTITVGTNTDKILDTIKNFVSEYNKVLEQVNTKLGEERYRKFDPLTEEQKEAMSDKQVELWEEKARSGLLRNDSILSQTVSNLRMAATSGFGDPADKFNIQTIGITTGKWFEGGKLVIENEQALRDAIEADPEKIMSLFTAKSAEEPAAGYSKVNNPNTGVFTRMSDILMDSLKQLSDRAGTSQTSTSSTGSFLENSLLGTQKRDLNSRMADLNRRLTMLETQYYKQFTAMETAINRYNSQAGSLGSFMNG
ncbi:flagellar cap protein FliD [Paenibacillus sp. 1011MAR3C5]|uniref:flagellar filament capping protein FliD n=1 Tax=Paenibacillus sp. 1011MAR3C5 TaxID=1675787 RepID=UPI000E6C1289|nr:flagellar filament capping protein FliD [Paenibacillus sp. 1011MAR3C5]RJE85639.1 flagellar cap protein FliD [Paenibacillus sp. 1011MAR3C5]